MAKAKAKTGKSAKPVTKSEIVSGIADQTALTRKQVQTVFDSLNGMIKTQLKRGPGVFTIPGLLKLRVIHKPAQPARRGVNPFTGQEQDFKAKPARNVVKANPLKALKDMVS